MKKLVPAALLVMVLIAAPVLAQETTGPDTPVEAPPDESTEVAPEPGPPLAPETSSALETLLQDAPLQEDTPQPQDSPPQDSPPQDVAPPPDLLPEDVLPEDVLPEAPPLPAPPPQASQEEVEDQEADEGVPKPEITAQEADSDELDQEVGDRLDDIADLRQRIEDQLDDAPSLQQRDGDRKENNDDDDKDNEDDDNGPGRKDSNDRDDDVKQETDQEAESGEVDQSIDVSNTGDYASQCVGIVQAANTGNAQNAPAFLQDSGDADDFEPGGIGIDISPQLVQDCRQIIQQTTIVNQLLSGAGQSRAGQPGPRVPGTVVAGLPTRIAGAGFNSAGGSGGAFNVPTRLGQSAIGLSGIGQARVQPLSAPSPGRMLPRTGGPGAISLLTLGAGALLIAGGLLVRRISR